jgi:hypothetical protein
MMHARRGSDQPESKRSRRRVTYVALLAGGAVAVAFAAAGAALWFNSNRTTDVAEVTAQIQAERAVNIRRSCEETNARHDGTIAELHSLVAAIPDPARRARAQDGMAGTIALIEALVPKRDCEALVERQVRAERPKPTATPRG